MYSILFKLISILQVIQDVSLVSLHNKTIVQGRDCSVYEVNNSIKVEYLIKGSKFNLGFLRANTTQPPPLTQIFIYFEGDCCDKCNGSLQLFINNIGVPSLNFNGALIGKSEHPLPPNQYFPSWYTLLVRIHKKEVTVKRSDFIHYLVKSKLPPELPEEIKKIEIHSPTIQHVTLNCLAHCPTFNSTNVGNLTLSFNNSLDIFLKSGIAANKFKYSLSVPSQNKTFSRSAQIPTRKEESILKLNIIRNETITKQCTITNGNKKQDFNYYCTNETITFISFIADKSYNISWSFNCIHPNDLKAAANHSEKQHFAGKSPFGIGIGEVVAWVIASLSLCGLIIIALTLYTRMNSNNWIVGGTESAISDSHINSMEMVTFPRIINKSMFFRELRKPEVGSVRESNISLDKLYPLKFEMEGNRSQRDLSFDLENFSSLRSDKTTLTTISNF